MATSEEITAAAERRAVVEHCRNMLMTIHGQKFVTYLIRDFDVGALPEMGLPIETIHERLGEIRTANEIFNLFAEAEPELVGTLLARVRKAQNNVEND